MKTDLTIKAEEEIKERVPGDSVPALKSIDPALTKYDFSNLTEMVDFAKVMAQGGPMLPKHARGNAGVCLAIYMRARHWGIDPFGLAQETYQAGTDPNAPVAYQARVYSAVAINNGINFSYTFTGETHFTAEKATSSKGNKVSDQTAAGTRQVTVRGEVAGEMREYTTPMLKDIKVKNSPLWHNDPDQQLSYYAARAWMRRYRPDLMMGALSVDELEDASPMRDVTPKQPGGWAQQAQAAREEALPADQLSDEPNESSELDAEPDPDAHDEPERFEDESGTHWTADVDPEQGAPGSKEWDEGVAAFKDGKDITDCPYQNDLQAAQDWMGAFAGARKASS